MFCSRCGSQVNGNKFCPNCGNRIEQQNFAVENTPLVNQNVTNNDQVKPTSQVSVQPIQIQSMSQPVQPSSITSVQHNPVPQSIPVQPLVTNYTPNQQPVQSAKKTNQIIIGVCIACAVIIIAVAYSLITSNGESVYFSDGNNVNPTGGNNVNNNGNRPSSNTGVTSIEHDNFYSLSVPTTEDAVIEMIKQDSEKEKEGCPQEIVEIENRIVSNYEITAVNLCELDLSFALEVEKIVEYIYNEFPTARGYLSHISLGNLDSSFGSTIAFFQWYTRFTMSTQDSNIGYKSRIILNSAYYLNLNKFKAAVTNSSNSGHFPENATIYSPLVHEFAHYLSFIATNNYYGTNPRIIHNPNDYYADYYSAMVDFSNGSHSKRMVEEAYNNYKTKTGSSLTLDQFRATISKYAMAKDETGNYIWDETVAESFHDVYLNGDNAADASKEVVAVLRKYVEM